MLIFFNQWRIIHICFTVVIYIILLCRWVTEYADSIPYIVVSFPQLNKKKEAS